MVKDLLLHHWGIPKPEVLISVIGGDEMYESNPVLADAISEGMAKVRIIINPYKVRSLGCP